MKKFAKMSLVAAIAVAGMTTANAGSLSDAIKNTDVTGSVYIETVSTDTNYDKNNTRGTAGATLKDNTANLTDINVDITFTSKVNDNVSSVVKIEADSDKAEDAGVLNHSVDLEQVYFAYANGPLTAKVGMQALATPTTDGERAIGVSAAYNLGAATIAGAYFYDNNAPGLIDGDISAIAVLGSIGPVNAEAWYVNASQIASNLTVAANTSFAGVTLGARYATTDYDGKNNAGSNYKDGNTLRVDLGYSIAGLSLSAMYLTTDKDGAAYASDTGAANTYELSQFSLSKFGAATAQNDLDVYALGASYNMDSMTYAIAYVNAEDEAKTEMDELRLRATYQMSSNFAIMATYSMMEADYKADASDYDADSARLEAKYSF